MQAIASQPPLELTLDKTPDPLSRYRITDKKGRPIGQLKNPVPGLLAKMEEQSLVAKNPEIAKYFEGLRTDPVYNKKGISYDIGPTHVKADGEQARVKAWCAAFVNWCLKEAGARYLNYATARSWLDFGIPVTAPVYGCVTVIKPQTSTGGGTGHVAFFVGRKGKNVQLLGRNQSRRVKVSEFKEKRQVLGFRWPSSLDDYLASGGQPFSELPAWAK